MLDYLLIMLVAAALIQFTTEGRAAACTFAGLTVAFDLIRVPAELYYLSACTTDGICALLLARIATKNSMAFDLQNLCLLSLVINGAGWVAQQNETPPLAYDSTFLVFYSVVIASLIMRRIGDAHGSTTTYRPWIPVHFYSCYLNNREH